MLLALKAANIEQKDIQTSRVSLQPQYPANRSGPAPAVGYRASNRVTVRLHDVLKVASTIDILVDAGATDMGGIGFSVSNASKLLDDARGQAIADARRKAEIYAKAAGVALGAPLDISEQGAPGPMPFRKMRRGHGGVSDAGRAGRRDAAGECERILGDQAGSVVLSSRALEPHPEERALRASRRMDAGPRASRRR